jgi:hypothetical protein
LASEIIQVSKGTTWKTIVIEHRSSSALKEGIFGLHKFFTKILERYLIPFDIDKIRGRQTLTKDVKKLLIADA